MSKLGPHFIGAKNVETWIAAGPQVYKFDPMSLGSSSLVPPGPLVVGKLDQQDDAIGITDWKALFSRGLTPEAAADLRFAAQRSIYGGPNKPRIDRYLANSRIDVWEDDNEVPPDNEREALWYSTYCIEMMRLYESIGKRRANFSFAVGTPELTTWLYLLPTVRYARDHGHFVALHEYMGYEADYGVGWKQIAEKREPLRRWFGRKLTDGSPDETYPYGWAALRYRAIYDTIFAPVGLGDVKLLITELGCDSVDSVTPADMPVGTWKELSPHWAKAGRDPEETYAGMLAWYDARMREDAFVVGATVFTVGSVGIWANWDIADTGVESRLQAHIRETAEETSPPVPPTIPPTVANLLINPSFEDGWTDSAAYTTTQNPRGWMVDWNLNEANPYPDSQPYQVGECVHKSREMLPVSEQDQFVTDGNWTLKVFAGNRAFWATLRQTVAVVQKGIYRLTVPVWVDCYKWDGRKDYNVDPRQCEARITVTSDVHTTIGEWTALRAGGLREYQTQLEFSNRGDYELTIELRCNWAISNNLWLDDLKLTAINQPAPVEPEPMPRHKAIVLKLPQDVTADEWQKAADYGYQYRHTMTASHDDMLTLLRGGNSASYVKLAWPDRQPDVATMIAAAGYTWVPLLDEPESPLKGLVLGRPFAWRFAMTSAFNAPRDYANKRHEGTDYDIVGGVADNTADVLALYDGVVDRSLDSTGGYGKYVRLAHERNGSPFYTRYGHMDKRYVEVGQKVPKGDALGEVGTTGRVTGEHVHINLEVPGFGLSGYVVADVVDPAPYIPSGADLPLYEPAETVDLLPFLQGDGRMYEVRHPDGSTETFQTQADGATWYQVKNRQWEEFYSDGQSIWRGVDTSPGNGRAYIQFEPGLKRARWCPRRMRVGQTWTGPGHTVQFKMKADCSDSALNSGPATNRITLVAVHPVRVFNGIAVAHVAELTDGRETFWFARGFGLVAWSSPWGQSSVIQLYATGERPNLVREKVNCF